jgi:hypothetical protein
VSTNNTFEVARIEGIGGYYVIVRDMDNNGLCTVTMHGGGPVSKTVLSDVQWLEAMQYVANEVETDLCTECSVVNDAELTITQK